MEKNQENISPKDVQKMVIDVLSTIYDPEIPVDIYQLGLIYEVKVSEDFDVVIEMTLTSPHCPVAESLPEEVRTKTEGIWAVKSAEVNIVWDPTWDKDMMSEEAKLELGFL